MDFHAKAFFANPDFGWSNKVRLPEYRHIELYTKPRALMLMEPPLPEELAHGAHRRRRGARRLCSRPRLPA